MPTNSESCRVYRYDNRWWSEVRANNGDIARHSHWYKWAAIDRARKDAELLGVDIDLLEIQEC